MLYLKKYINCEAVIVLVISNDLFLYSLKKNNLYDTSTLIII